MKRIKLNIVGLSYSQTQSGAYALVLSEVNGKRRLPIVIGPSEAQAIAIALEALTPHRPLTHDLFKHLAEAFHIVLEEIIIYNLVDGVFYAKLICTDGIKKIEIDSRTSDAVALAVRFECPIITNESILSVAGIVVENNDFSLLENTENKKDESNNNVSKQEDENLESLISSKTKNELSDISSNELKRLLEEALDSEEYEKAARIRDELNKRKKQ